MENEYEYDKGEYEKIIKNLENCETIKDLKACEKNLLYFLLKICKDYPECRGDIFQNLSLTQRFTI